MNNATLQEVDHNLTDLAHADMVFIPAGSFLMGSDSGAESESPVHQILLPGFWMDVYPVTNDRFADFVAATHYRTTAEMLNERCPKARKPIWSAFASSRDQHPVVCVSWEDAQAFAKWKGKRLPTEAEWEKAARGGIEDALFPWGNDQPDDQMCTWNRASAADGDAPGTTEVGLARPNPYGLVHMTGNVWQWCKDWFSDTYYADSASESPTGPTDGKYRVRRGGAWNVREAFRLRCANRGAMSPDGSWPNLGFRCVLDKG
jgi:formylglycine-generating enzyme required for sulfatase activity